MTAIKTQKDRLGVPSWENESVSNEDREDFENVGWPPERHKEEVTSFYLDFLESRGDFEQYQEQREQLMDELEEHLEGVKEYRETHEKLEEEFAGHMFTGLRDESGLVSKFDETPENRWSDVFQLYLQSDTPEPITQSSEGPNNGLSAADRDKVASFGFRLGLGLAVICLLTIWGVINGGLGAIAIAASIVAFAISGFAFSMWYQLR